mmetsp:Transcript_42765/g.118085  ORF Transcript_42765/g.118085 Transcript_42765/m.118085 type:complete len:456 (-) Transcript_42765:645-2012(-)
MRGLAEELRYPVRFVQLRQKLELQFVLYGSDEVEANRLWHAVPHVPHRDCEVRIEALPNLVDERPAVALLFPFGDGVLVPQVADLRVCRLRSVLHLLHGLLSHARLLLLLLWRRWRRLLSLVVHGFHRAVFREVLRVVREEVTGVTSDLLFHDDASVLLLPRDDVLRHLERAVRELREPAEDRLRDALRQDVQGRGHVVHALHGGHGELLQVRQGQELEGVRRGEARQRVAFVHPDGLVDVLVGHLVGDRRLHEVPEELVHGPAHPGAAGHRHLAAAAGQAGHVPLKLSVVLPAYGVLEHLAIIGNHRPHDLHALVLLEGHALAKLVEPVLDAPPFLVDLLLDLGEEAANVLEQNLRELFDQDWCADQAWRQFAVQAVVLKVHLLLLEGLRHKLLVADVLLAAHLDADVAKSQRDLLPAEHFTRVGALVHDVDLRDNTDGAQTLRVNLPRQLKRV